MTTYGTIPALTPPSSSTQEFISIAKERIRSGFSNQKPWAEMINLHSFTFPTTTGAETMERLTTNLSYFRVNYATIILFTLFLILLWHPISLLVFIILVSLWLFFYFLRDESVMIFGLVITDRGVLIGLAVMTVGLLWSTGVTGNIIVGVVIGVALVVVHGILKRNDYLFVGEYDGDGEGIGTGGGGGDGGGGGGRSGGGAGERMALKETASSSYSLL